MKRLEGPRTTSDVTAQLARYVSTALIWYDVVFVPGTAEKDKTPQWLGANTSTLTPKRSAPASLASAVTSGASSAWASTM